MESFSIWGWIGLGALLVKREIEQTWTEGGGNARDALNLQARAAEGAACKLLIDSPSDQMKKFTLVRAGRLCIELCRRYDRQLLNKY